MPLTTSTPLQGDRPSLRITGNTGSRQSEATRRPGAATPIATSERPPSLPSPEGSDRSGAPLRRLPLNRPRPAEELARPPLAASPPSRPKPWSRINRLRPAPPRGQLASTPWDEDDSMPFSEPLNQNFHQEFELLSCGFRLQTPIRNCNFTYGSHSHNLSTPCPHALEIALQTHPCSFFRSICVKSNYTDMVVLNSDFFFLDP